MFVSKSFRILKCWLIELIAIIEFEESHLVHLDWIKTKVRFLIISFILLKIDSTAILQSTTSPRKILIKYSSTRKRFSNAKIWIQIRIECGHWINFWGFSTFDSCNFGTANFENFQCNWFPQSIKVICNDYFRDVSIYAFCNFSCWKANLSPLLIALNRKMHNSSRISLIALPGLIGFKWFRINQRNLNPRKFQFSLSFENVEFVPYESRWRYWYRKIWDLLTHLLINFKHLTGEVPLPLSPRKNSKMNFLCLVHRKFYQV